MIWVFSNKNVFTWKNSQENQIIVDYLEKQITGLNRVRKKNSMEKKAERNVNAVRPNDQILWQSSEKALILQKLIS